MLREALEFLISQRPTDEPISAEGRTFVRLGDGSIEEVKPLTARLPDNIIATPNFQDVASFAAYVASFKRDETIIFVDTQRRLIEAVIDYHSGEKPGHGQHRAKMQLRHSPEWQRWVSKHRQLIPQSDFAEQIEQNIGDIIFPNAGDLLDIVSTIEGRKEIVFKSGYRASDGTRRVVFEEGQSASSGEMSIPNKIDFCIPVYELGEREVVTALLRHRLKDGTINFRLDFVNHENVERQAVVAIADQLRNDLGCDVHLGSASG